MNKLIVPETTFMEKFKSVFLPSQKRAIFSNWLAMSIYRSLIVAVAAFLIVSILEGTIYGFFTIYALLVGLGYYTIDSRIVENHRKKIIVDMKSAKPFSRVHGFRGLTSGSPEWATYVPTMAGELHFIGDRFFSFIIVKKSGKLFNYYDFPEVEGLNPKDLRQFIAVKSDLD